MITFFVQFGWHGMMMMVARNIYVTDECIIWMYGIFGVMVEVWEDMIQIDRERVKENQWEMEKGGVGWGGVGWETLLVVMDVSCCRHYNFVYVQEKGYYVENLLVGCNIVFVAI